MSKWSKKQYMLTFNSTLCMISIVDGLTTSGLSCYFYWYFYFLSALSSTLPLDSFRDGAYTWSDRKSCISVTVVTTLATGSSSATLWSVFFSVPTLPTASSSICCPLTRTPTTSPSAIKDSHFPRKASSTHWFRYSRAPNVKIQPKFSILCSWAFSVLRFLPVCLLWLEDNLDQWSLSGKLAEIFLCG